MTKLRFLFALMISLAVAPALAGAKEDSGETHQRSGFFVSQFSDFRAIDGKHVVLYGATRKNAFLATLFSYCSGLTFADKIGVDSNTRFISNRSNAAIIVHNEFRQRCLIQRLEPVDNYKSAKALVEKRKKLAAKSK